MAQVYILSEDSEEKGKFEGVPTILNLEFSAEEMKQGTFVVIQIKSASKE